MVLDILRSLEDTISLLPQTVMSGYLKNMINISIDDHIYYPILEGQSVKINAMQLKHGHLSLIVRIIVIVFSVCF